MQHFSFLSHDGCTTIAAYQSVPSGEIRAMLQISHGMCEHLGRYGDFASFLSQNGILVFGHDHIGHGASAQSTAALGFTVPAGGSEVLIEDVHRLSMLMKQRYPDIPLVLFGHSMGSFIARAVLARYGTDYNAAILCGTAGPEAPTAAGKLLANLLMLFFGEYHRSRLLKKIAFSGYNKRCGKDCDPNAWLSCDESVVDAYNADPACGFTFTLRAYHDLFTILGEISRKDWAGKIPPDLPILITGGEEDPVGAYGKGLQVVHQRLEAAGVRDVSLRLYPQMRHEILNELDKEMVWSEIYQWIQAKLN
ncbi:MAG: lysophospholipase [Clostridia bacterium]|nr:lysophospholipase [Clostridia bacterium]